MMRYPQAASLSRRGAHVVAAALVAVAGCDPGWQMTGSVRAEGGAPVAGATITTKCPDDRPPLPTSTSDANGAIHGGGVGYFRDECNLEVRAQGFAPQTVPVRGVCRRRAMGSCVAVELRVTLHPEHPPQ